MNALLVVALLGQLAAPPIDAGVVVAATGGTVIHVAQDAQVDVKAPAWIYDEPAHVAVDNSLKKCQYDAAHPPVAGPDVKAYLIGGGIVASVFTTVGIAIGAGIALSTQKK